MDEKADINGKAIVSVVLGVLSLIIPLFGFVLGIIGLYVSRVAKKEINKTSMGGMDFATFGLIFNVLGILYQIKGVVNLITTFNV